MPSGRRIRSRTTSRYSAPRDVRDDAAQDPVAQVGVVEDGTRRPGEGRTGRQQLREPVQRKPLLAVAPRIVSGKSGRHRQQLAHGHRDAVRGREAPGGELRDVRGDGFVQPQASLVPQEQHGGRGEGLGHRRDAEHGARIRPAVLADAGRAGAAGMRQCAVTDHAPGDPGDPGLVREAVEAAVEGAEGVVEGRHRDMMPGRPPGRDSGSTSPLTRPGVDRRVAAGVQCSTVAVTSASGVSSTTPSALVPLNVARQVTVVGVATLSGSIVTLERPRLEAGDVGGTRLGARAAGTLRTHGPRL